MKIFIVSITCLIVTVSAMASTVQVDRNGEVRVIPQERNWRDLTIDEMQVYSNPGEQIRIWDTSVEKISFFYKAKVANSTQAVVFDGENIKYVDTEKVVAQSEPQLLIYKLFLLLSMGLMVIVNVAYAKECKGATFATIFLPTTFATATTAVVLAFYSATLLATFTTILAASFAPFPVVYNNRRLNITFSTIFYILCLIALLV